MKKKIFLAFLATVIISTNVYCGVILKQSVSGFGYNNETEINPFDEQHNFSKDFFLWFPFCSTALSCVYEFFPEEQVHLTTGLSLGFGGLICYYTLNLGTAFELKQTEKHIVDLNFSVQPGAYQPLLDAMYPFYFIKANLDFEIMSPDRKGFFFTPGITNEMYFECIKYKDYGVYWFSVDTLVLQFTLGYRF